MTQKEETSILVLYTGGTIGMMQDPKTGALVPFDFDNIYKHLPVLQNFGYQIDFYSFNPLIDSSNMSPDFCWPPRSPKTMSSMMASWCFTVPIPWLTPPRP